jgi:hypothetical protein
MFHSLISQQIQLLNVYLFSLSIGVVASAGLNGYNASLEVDLHGQTNHSKEVRMYTFLIVIADKELF